MRLITVSLVSFISSIGVALADSPAAVPAGTAVAQQPPGMGAMLVPFIAMFAVMYFLMIRPQQKRMKEQQNMLSALKEGDEILTASGILGTVKGINEKVVTVEVDRNVQLKMLKSQVSQVLKGQQNIPEKLA